MKLVLALCTLLLTMAHAKVGGFKPVGEQSLLNDEGLQRVANFAVDKISAQQNGKLDLVGIIGAEKQVVAGMNYLLTLELATPQQQKQRWEAKVYQPLGDQPLQLSESKQLPFEAAAHKSEATGERAAAPLLGASKELSTTDPEVQEAASWAAQQLSQQSNSLVPFEVKEVMSAKSKVVAGKQYELKLKLSRGTAEEIQDVTVTRSLPGNQYSLDKHSSVASA